MSTDDSITVDHCFSWTMRPIEDERVHSPDFTIQNMKSHLDFGAGIYVFGSCYSLYLVCECDPVDPFDLSAQLVIGTNVVSLQRTTVRESSERIWSGWESEILEVVPDGDQRPFLFMIVLHNSATLEGMAEDKCTQTSLHSDTNLGIQSLSEYLSKLLDEDSSADVELKCSDVTFKAHKNVLSARSKVFRAMLENDMKEGKTGKVDIVDTEADVLRQLLRYIYSGKLEELTMDAAMQLYEVGDKYDVEALKRQCASYLADNLSPDNACAILGMADHHTDSDLKETAIAYILHQKVPLQDDIWDDFCDEHPVLANKVFKRFCKLQASSK